MLLTLFDVLVLGAVPLAGLRRDEDEDGGTVGVTETSKLLTSG